MSGTSMNTARELVQRHTGERYIYGQNCIAETGPATAALGRRALVVANPSAWLRPALDAVLSSLQHAGVHVLGPVPGSRPNSPYEDVFRVQAEIEARRPDVLVGVGAGSTIDALKAAAVLATLTPGAHDLEPFFGAGLVTAALRRTGRRLPPMVAVETAASSASHLTRYANVTDLAAGQKKLIIDEAIVPTRAVFDYRFSASMPPELTRDGGNDGISHCLEVYLGARPDAIDAIEPVALTGIELIARHLPGAVENGDDLDAREGLGLGTDLGGCAIMLGGTNGAHLNSFSLVDILSHGRACAVLNPYYVVFFAPAVERQLRALAAVYQRAGFADSAAQSKRGRDLGVAVATAMQRMNIAIGFPTRLDEIPGFHDEHMRRALAAAKNPQLASKLQQMPVPMPADDVDHLMGSVLTAAQSGDFDAIEAVESDGLSGHA